MTSKNVILLAIMPQQETFPRKNIFLHKFMCVHVVLINFKGNRHENERRDTEFLW